MDAVASPPNRMQKLTASLSTLLLFAQIAAGCVCCHCDCHEHESLAVQRPSSQTLASETVVGAAPNGAPAEDCPCHGCCGHDQHWPAPESQYAQSPARAGVGEFVPSADLASAGLTHDSQNLAAPEPCTNVAPPVRAHLLKRVLLI